jgi:hypothetical protein
MPFINSDTIYLEKIPYDPEMHFSFPAKMDRTKGLISLNKYLDDIV